MGDQLEDDNWEAQKSESDDEDISVAADWVEEGDSNDDEDDEVESIQEWKDEANKEAKKLKRQAKFAAMKDKKRQKIAEEEAAKDAEDDAGRESDKAQLTPQEMLRDIALHAPVPYRTYQQQAQDPFFIEDDFFYPALDPSAVTESTTKAPCPFTRALSASFPNYKKILLKSENTADKHGSPIMVIVTASAIRATEIIKSVSSKLIKVKIGKLFAKHFKLSEQIEMLSKSYFPIVIGTPNRIEKLIELGALTLKETKVLLVDYTADLKSFTTLTLPDVKNDFYKLFYDYVHKEKDHIKIALVKDTNSPSAKGIPSSGGNKTKKRGYGKFDNSQRKGLNPTEGKAKDGRIDVKLPREVQNRKKQKFEDES
jgi:protein CMS1